MSMTDQGEDAAGVQRALLAHLRQEFTAPALAIVGYTDMLIEDAKRLSMNACLADLERIHSAGRLLNSLLQSVLARESSGDDVIFDRAKLRHDLRTPINAIKGYGEMLAEDAATDGEDALLPDLRKLLVAAEGMLKRIDALVEFRGQLNDEPGADTSAHTAGPIEAVRAIRAVAARPGGSDVRGRILVVDDNASNRDLLSRQLTRVGHEVEEADGGRAALAKLAKTPADLILLDLMMPDISGYEVLCQLKSQPETRDIPVILISALDDLNSIIRCIEAGAVDYLLKPSNPTLLSARVGASLENKVLRDREKLMFAELQREKARYEDLLLSILPRSVVDRISAGETIIADQVDDVTILFADIVNFTRMAGQQSADDLVQFLNSIFTEFDNISQQFGAEKIKTIGDAYMVALGLPDPRPDHAKAAAHLARAMMKAIRAFRASDGASVDLRIGMHTGPAIAGVIGQRKFSFDVWGTTVNIASRMESLGEPGKIQISEAVVRSLDGQFSFVDRGMIDVKGSGMMRTFFLGEPTGLGEATGP